MHACDGCIVPKPAGLNRKNMRYRAMGKGQGPPATGHGPHAYWIMDNKQ